MFADKKKNESENAGTRMKGRRGEEKIEFDFEEDDKLPFDDEDYDDGYSGDDGEDVEEIRMAKPRRGLSASTIILALLLLLAVGGGGYYYLNSTPVPMIKSPVVVTNKVKVPATIVPQSSPVATAAVKPASPNPVVAVAPAKSPQPAPNAKATAAVVQAPAPLAKATAPAPLVKATAPAPLVKATAAAPLAKAPTPAPLAKATAPVAVVLPEAKSEVTSPVASVPATPQPFTLSAGAFLSQKHLHDMEKKIRRLGYTPKIQTTYRMVPMTRLLIGIYDPAAAEAQRKVLIAQIPDLFTLKQGDKVALYAGSYQSLDAARSFYDQLYLRGILVDEETVPLRMPLKMIGYGSFETRAVAEKAAKRAITAGLTAQVIKR